jgi:predicted CXXCH cytochrome family protein
MRLTTMIILSFALATTARGQGQSVVNSKHNLSTSGPGAIRATTEDEVCIFCHTPHRATPIQPLWNRATPASGYQLYTSSSLDAQTGQPTGASKMCLSCHDGTIALGSVISRDQVIQMAGGITTIPPGSTGHLGTDLSDDHPISFRYDGWLAATDRDLADPTGLPAELPLDANRELQCTTCHDAHDNSFGHFLSMSNEGSMMCRSCHRLDDTTILEHQSCSSCHRSHTAPSGPFLLTGSNQTSTCIGCHDGSESGSADIASLLTRFSTHDTDPPVDPPDPEMHATCSDCHEPHTMSSGSAIAPAIPMSLGEISGANLSGVPVETAAFEYEVCFKCHADVGPSLPAYVPREIVQTNTRLEFQPSAISFHPVTAPGRNSDVPSLKPAWSVTDVMYCSDCHGSDASRKWGGAGPNGVHGSNEPPLLLARYDTTDYTPESSAAYALCYGCHQRGGSDGILSDRSFPHSLHVVEEQTPCSVCHDAHGIASVQGTSKNNSHLINFDVTIVFPHPATGQRVFRDEGMFTGSCTLSCHGKVHTDEDYSE